MAQLASRGISGGRVDYGKPLEATGDGNAAYIVLPTTYRFTQNEPEDGLRPAA